MAAKSQREIHIFKDSAAIAQRAAEIFVEAAKSAVAQNGTFTVALAGGSTPKILYSLLATDPGLRGKLPWDKMQMFFGDERHVGPDDAQSNFKMASETMLSKAPLKAEQIHRMKGEYPDAEQAAKEYEQELRAQFHLKESELPRFDLVLVGMGDEGHCLSLFPGTKALHPAEGRIVVRNWVGKLYTDRITITAAGGEQRCHDSLYGGGKRKSSGVKSRARRSLRAGTIAVAIAAADQRKTAVARGPGRRQYAF